MIKREEEDKLKILLKLPPPITKVSDEVDEEELFNLVKNGKNILDELNNNKEFNNPEHLNVKYLFILENYFTL
jgi:hypothetical protein